MYIHMYTYLLLVHELSNETSFLCHAYVAEENIFGQQRTVYVLIIVTYIFGGH